MSDHLLQNALQNLPRYEPPAAVWPELEQRLGELPLHAALQGLPDYAPPAAAWEQLEARLPSGAVRRRISRPVWAAAAALALLLGAVVFFQFGGAAPARVSEKPRLALPCP